MAARRKPSRDWSSTPRELRRRKPLQVTLAAEQRAELEKLAEKHGGVSLSVAVEAAIVVLSRLAPFTQRAAIRDAVERAKSARTK
jgi:hypothetical protein